MGGTISKSENTSKSDINLSDFELLRSAGRGAFGKVKIIRSKNNNELLALKYMNKIEAIKNKFIKNAIRERNILESLYHPFITNMIFSFQDDDYIFMGLEFMSGGDLRFYTLQHIPEDTIRFYMAEISCALMYLHSNNIIHRDVKPDNILLDSAGHAHLTDFNISTYISSKHRTRSGTSCYMAPEVSNCIKYGVEIDWWSLGVTLYELLFCVRPFNKYCNYNLNIPDNNYSHECIDFLKGLLEYNPVLRYSGDDIKSHKFFDGISWELLEEKEIPPPYTPCFLPNFSPVHDLEESTNPNRLKYRPRTKNTGLDKNMLKIERLFKYFNREIKNGCKYYTN